MDEAPTWSSNAPASSRCSATGSQWHVPGATLLLFGIMSAKEGALPFYDLYFKELTVQNGRAATGADFPPTIELAASGKVQLDPLITHRLPITEADASMKMLEADVDGRMKIILENAW